MTRREGTLLELGDRVSGRVLDADMWERQSRIRLAMPYRRAAGEVHVVYPFAPRVVGLVLASGEQVHVHLDPRTCGDCGHDAHDPGDCLVASTSVDGDTYCLCPDPPPEPVVAVAEAGL